ncbi:MAG TPA: DUF3014 domain-containing protein [Burkholderiaceae bacterium]|nr:DUF3014 domain-containing protein [Burkholderiaceae bacterium]
MNKTTTLIVAAVVLLAIAAAVLWQRRAPEAPPTPPIASAPAPAPAPVPAAAEPEIKHPIEPAPQDEQKPLPALEKSDAYARGALVEWLGRQAVQNFLQTDDFVRHFVATVDNLGRAHAPPRLWPVNPMPGRFGVQQTGDSTVATAGNAERYAPFVTFVERLDTQRGVALYVHNYPLFQRAYEELGYPKKYFNDRLVEVVDLLIATPVPAQPPALRLTEVKGPIPATQPWLRYEFADPELQALSSGQRMLLRTGAQNQRRLQAKLVEIRKLLTTGAAPR